MQLLPQADLLYFCDKHWFEWHQPAVMAFAGIKATLENIELPLIDPAIRCLRNYGPHGFAPSNDGVCHGHNSGYQAMHLAAWLGVKRMILLGFDMKAQGKRAHWHEEHPIPTSHAIFATSMLPSFKTLAGPLKARGIEVINCTPDSALNTFPKMPLEDALCIPA